MVGHYGTWARMGAMYGSEPTEKEKTPILEQLLPLVPSVIEQTTDPYRRAEILKVKIAKARAYGRSPWYIQKLEAKLRAAERQVGEEEEFEVQKGEWSFIGKAAAMTGIAVGVATILRILRK